MEAKTDKELLVELGRIRKAPFGKRVLHYFSSMAMDAPDFTIRRDKALRLLKDGLSAGASWDLFSLSCGDIVFTYSQISSAVLMTLLQKLDGVFFPAGETPKKNVYGEVGFYKLFDASRDLNQLVDGVRAVVAEGLKSNPKQLKEPIGLKQYQFIADTLQKADIRSIIFNQPIYFSEHSTPSIEFLEFYVSIDRLEQALCPQYSITANPWLFNLVKRDLDLALLRMLPGEIANYRHKAFSVNSLVATFLSPDFLRFIQSLPARLSGKIMVELDKGDVIQHSDCIGQIAARSRELNVPVCIDGLSHHDLRLMKLSHIDASFVKVKWSSEMAAMAADHIETFVRELRSNSGLRTVLTRCDSPKALAFARATGMGFIQGRLADQFFKLGANLTAA